jgi:Ca2+-binding EF-hand superfamily protein
MDTDKNGKISRQEYMTFMENEFDRLDKDKSGELDPKELVYSQLRVSHVFMSAGKQEETGASMPGVKRRFGL